MDRSHPAATRGRRSSLAPAHRLLILAASSALALNGCRTPAAAAADGGTAAQGTASGTVGPGASVHSVTLTSGAVEVVTAAIGLVVLVGLVLLYRSVPHAPQNPSTQTPLKETKP